MAAQSSTQEPELDAKVPPVEALATDVVARFCLAAHAYLEQQDAEPDTESAQMAIDVASAAFERVKERLRPEERLAITQLLTESRMTFVKKRGVV